MGLRWVGIVLLLAASLVGCHKGEESTSAAAPPGATVLSPEERLRDRMRAGSVQISGILEDLQDALALAKTIRADIPADRPLRSPLNEVIEALDGAGEALGDYATETPPIEEFTERFAQLDDRRLNAIDAANDARQRIRSAFGVLDGLPDGMVEDDPNRIQQLAEMLEVMIADLEDAIFALGGRVEQVDDEGS